MHARNCNCGACASAGELQIEAFEYEEEGSELFESADEYTLNESEEMELAMELLSVSSEAELDQFLGKLVKSAWKGIKKVGSVVGTVAKPFSGVLKAVAKKALPWVGGALGSLIPIPGVGTAVGSALGGALSKALELETTGMSYEDQEFEMARRFVRVATTAARNVASTAAPANSSMLNQAIASAARQHLPQFQYGGVAGRSMPAVMSGRWVRRGRHIVVIGV
jgi:hypothetical protein